MTPEVNTIVAVRMSNRDGDVRHVDVAEYVSYDEQGRARALKRFVLSYIAAAIIAEGEDESASVAGFLNSAIRDAMQAAGCERTRRNRQNKYYLPKLLQLLAEGKGNDD